MQNMLFRHNLTWKNFNNLAENVSNYSKIVYNICKKAKIKLYVGM